jgi:chitinase
MDPSCRAGSWGDHARPPSHIAFLLLLTLLVLVSFSAAAEATAPAPQFTLPPVTPVISFVSPGSCAQGATVGIEVFGTNLQTFSEVWLTNDAGNRIEATGEIPSADKTYISCRLAVPPSAVYGNYTVWVSGYDGNGALANRFLVTPGGAGHVAAAPSNGTWVSGYYVAYHHDRLPPDRIEWSGLTHVVMGRVVANPDGTLDLGFDIGAPEGPALAREVARLAHDHETKAVLMLGGAGNGAAIREAVRDHRAAFVANLIATMRDYGYDGLDLDWEDEVDWALFETFARDLRAAAPEAILSLPIGCINANYQAVEPGAVNVSLYVDQVNLMSYYPSTAWAGDGWSSWHNSPLKGAKPTTPVSIEDSLARYAAAGIPKGKLGMGIGFYAIGYADGITGPDQPTAGGSIRGGDNDYPLSLLYGDGPYEERYRRWDATAREPYLSLPAPDRFGCRYVSFEDEQSILEKGRFARENGYGGTIVWTIDQGYVASHADPVFLFRALRAGFIDTSSVRPIAVSVRPEEAWVAAGGEAQFRSLVTGTVDREVSWSVAESGGGTVDANGTYRASAGVTGTRTVHLVATSRADPSRSATVAVTVADAAAMAWDPGLHRRNCAEWWMEVHADATNVTAIDLEHAGTTTPMGRTGWDYDGKPNFAVSVRVQEGETIRYVATSRDGRRATTRPIAYTYTASGEILDCPIEAPAPTPTLTVMPFPGASAPPHDSDADGKYEDVNGNGRKDFADVVLYFNQITWIAANEPVAAFDYNGNGRIDFADVVWLFAHL